MALDEDLGADVLNSVKVENEKPDPMSLERVLSGSCACVAHVRGPHLHTANVGDSMAVLGVCNAAGVWSARQLTKVGCSINDIFIPSPGPYVFGRRLVKDGGSNPQFLIDST